MFNRIIDWKVVTRLVCVLALNFILCGCHPQQSDEATDTTSSASTGAPAVSGGGSPSLPSAANMLGIQMPTMPTGEPLTLDPSADLSAYTWQSSVNLPDDVPVYPEAQLTGAMPYAEFVTQTFKSGSTVAEVVAYYEAALFAAGWTDVTKSGPDEQGEIVFGARKGARGISVEVDTSLFGDTQIHIVHIVNVGN